MYIHRKRVTIRYDIKQCIYIYIYIIMIIIIIIR